MKILLGNNSLSFLGGSETWSLTLAIALKRLGHEVTCFGPTLGDISKALESEGIRCFDNMAPEGLKPFSLVLQKSVKHEYDFIIANHWHIVEYLRRQFPKIPIVSTVHGIIHYMDEEKKQPAPEHPSLNGGVSQFIAVSEEVQNMLKDSYNIESTIIRNFFDLKKFKASSVKKKPKQFLINTNYAGKDDPEIKLIKEVANHYDAKLTAVGQGFGVSSDIREAIKDADIVVGMGRSVLEGVAMGRLGIVHGRWGTGGVIHEGMIKELRERNFSGRNSGDEYWTKERFIQEIDEHYKKKTFDWQKGYMAINHNAENAAQIFIGIGEDLLGLNIKK